MDVIDIVSVAYVVIALFYIAWVSYTDFKLSGTGTSKLWRAFVVLFTVYYTMWLVFLWTLSADSESAEKYMEDAGLYSLAATIICMGLATCVGFCTKSSVLMSQVFTLVNIVSGSGVTAQTISRVILHATEDNNKIEWRATSMYGIIIALVILSAVGLYLFYLSIKKEGGDKDEQIKKVANMNYYTEIAAVSLTCLVALTSLVAGGGLRTAGSEDPETSRSFIEALLILFGALTIPGCMRVCIPSFNSTRYGYKLRNDIQPPQTIVAPLPSRY